MSVKLRRIARWARTGTFVALLLSACVKDRPGERLPPAEASNRVTDLLYRRNLIADPEVQGKVNEYVLAMSRDGVPADSVMPELHQWLVAWAAAHPERASAARLAPGYQPSAGERAR